MNTLEKIQREELWHPSQWFLPVFAEYRTPRWRALLWKGCKKPSQNMSVTIYFARCIVSAKVSLFLARVMYQNRLSIRTHNTRPTYLKSHNDNETRGLVCFLTKKQAQSTLPIANGKALAVHCCRLDTKNRSSSSTYTAHTETFQCRVTTIQARNAEMYMPLHNEHDISRDCGACLYL